MTSSCDANRLAISLTSTGQFAYTPSSGGVGPIIQFRPPGAGNSLSAESIPASASASVPAPATAAASVPAPATAAASAPIPLTPDVLDTLAGHDAEKKTAEGGAVGG